MFPLHLWGERNSISNDKYENKQIASDFSLKNGKKFFFNMNNIILNEEDSSNEINSDKKEKDNDKKNTKINNKNNKGTNNENIINEEKKPLKNNFITDYKNELKCSCTKVQCDKLYCDCFRSKRYCINCHCRNCLNQPQKYQTKTNIKEINAIDKNNNGKKIFCTCTKSGCKLKYCECFKLKLECTDLCRCLKCKNSKIPIENNNKFNKICFINSICIINNILTSGRKELISKKKMMNKKRKRPKSKTKQNKEIIKEKKEEELNNNKEQNINNSLFDKNGNMIFTHININKIKKFQNYN